MKPLVFALFLAAALPAHSRGRSQAAAHADSSAGRRGFVRIPPGRFLMGSPPDEPGRFEDERQHRVTLTRAFDLTPIT